MAEEINIGDKVAIIATVGKRIEDRVTLHIPDSELPLFDHRSQGQAW